MTAFRLLVMDSVRSWLRPRGIALLLAAFLVPPALTAAWVFTHQSDISVSEVSHDANPLQVGKLVNVTATFQNELGRDADAFNATVQVGYFENRSGVLSFRSVKEQQFNYSGLAAKATLTATINWTAQPGTYILRAIADTSDELAEIEELNNERYEQVYVGFPSVHPGLQRPPTAQSSNASLVDFMVHSIAWEGTLFANQANRFTVDVMNEGPDDAANATLRLRIHQASPFGYSPTPSRTLSATFNLTAGNSTILNLDWTPTAVGQYAFFAFVEPSGRQADADASNDALIQEAFIDRQFLYKEPEPKATAKDFYRDVLANLHLRILIPLVALFFAAGVIEDERNRGSLAHLLTRPVPRWQIPIARFLAMMAVGSLALLAGIIVTYVLLLGLPQDPGGHFYWPLVFGVACLAAYGALFTLLGVWARKPYIVGLLYVLGIEIAIYLGRTVRVNDQPILEGWVGALSLTQWMLKAFDGWDPTASGQWIPAGSDAAQGLLVMLTVAVAGLAAAAWIAKRREFET